MINTVYLLIQNQFGLSYEMEVHPERPTHMIRMRLVAALKSPDIDLSEENDP